MSNNFDPTTHKFGMAYIQKYQNKVCYPFSGTRFDQRCVMQGGFIYETRTEELTRAPEHDLIPRSDHEEACQMIANQMETIRDYQLNSIPKADVMELVKALWWIKDVTACSSSLHIAENALSNFNQKYGDGA